VTDSESSPEQSTDGGRTVDEASAGGDESISLDEQFENIRQSRRQRFIRGTVIVALVGFLFFQALNASEIIGGEEFLWDFFFQSLRSFFPITKIGGVVPFLDIGGYIDFIVTENLLYDPEVASLLFRWPPDLYTLFFSGLGIFAVFGEAGITLAMGFAGTILGFPLALAFGVMGSERVTPFPFNFLFRGTMSFIRSIPALVWVLIFLPLAGLGPAAATIAIAVDTIGNLGRLFVDELEEISDGPIEAMQTTGATRPQIIVFGMLSQVKTAFIAWTLYILEINVRIAVSVGVLGAGGLGQVVEVQQGLRQFDQMMAALLCIFILIISVELFSQRLRSRLRSDEEKMSLKELIFGFPGRFRDSLLK
jgi:phosphonate transport system permease protein